MKRISIAITCLIFLLLLSSSTIYAQSWTEDPQVEVIVTDSHGKPVSIARTGQQVQIKVEAWTGDHYHLNPEVDISTDTMGMLINPDTARMTYDDPKDPLAIWYFNKDYQFLKYDPEGYWVWDLDKIDNEGLTANTLATLMVNALLINHNDEKINIKTDFVDVIWLGLGDVSHIDILVDTDTYSFDAQIREEPNRNHPITYTPRTKYHTIPMQPTGIPLLIGLLGIISITVGFVSKT